MIKPLRKYHFVFWRVLTLTLPLAFIAAIIVRPSISYVAPVSGDAFYFQRKSLSDSTSIISIIVNRPLTVPSCVVFNVTPTAEILMGKVDHQGRYDFVVDNPEKNVTIKLVDVIHQRTITSITLNEQ